MKIEHIHTKMLQRTLQPLQWFEFNLFIILYQKFNKRSLKQIFIGALYGERVRLLKSTIEERQVLEDCA